MELFIVFLLAGIGGAFWLNHVLKKRAEEQANSKTDEPVPYKVETPAEPLKCGCGRSPTGYCVGLHKLTEAEWAVHSDNPNKTLPVTETPIVETAKPVTVEEPVKKTRKPRTTKETKTLPAKKPRGRKPAAKKAISKKS